MSRSQKGSVVHSDEVGSTDELRLACEGGSPIRSTPFPAWPSFSDEEVEAAAAVLRSGKVNYWTGKEGRHFEEEFAKQVNAGYAVAVANGTNALEAALHAIRLKPGDEVVVTSRTFIASASCIVLCGGVPVFADVDPDSQNITAGTIEAVLSPRTRAIIAVHLAGWPCDMDSIMELAHRHGLMVIEDCAQAHGARYRGRHVGSLGHIAAFSFCQDKIMTTGGEGGMVTTSDEELWRSVWSIKDHGKGYDLVYNRRHPPGFRWLHEGFGTNWRLTEAQAAIGRIQLRKLSEWHRARSSNAEHLADAFRRQPALRVPSVPSWIDHAYYKFYVFVRSECLALGWDRDRIMSAVVAEGVPCYSGTCSEVYLEKAFEGTPWQPQERLPAARELGETSLMFLVHPGIAAADLDDVCRAVDKVLQTAAVSSHSDANLS